MKKIQFFEPAMCCSTGLCGVGVDMELLRISTVLATLQKHGIRVERFNLSSAPMAFVNNTMVHDFINKEGPEGLPLVVLDGCIVLSSRYPTNAEFTKWLDLSADLLTSSVEEAQESSGCCKGGCC